MLEVAEKKVKSMGAELAAAAAKPPVPPPPDLNFGDDYSTYETATLIMNQGGSVAPSGDVCCSADRLGQCQVQTQALRGNRYYDKTNQRARLEEEVCAAPGPSYAIRMSSARPIELAGVRL